MKSVKDFRRQALKEKGYFGLEAEMLLDWARDCDVSATNADDAMLELLRRSGSNSESLEAAWVDIYKLAGLTGSRAEMELTFWRDLKGQLPLAAMSGWTGKEYCKK